MATTDAKLSALLFHARESAEMLAVIVEARTNSPDVHSRRLVEEIDAYRTGRGWNKDGFGDETGASDLRADLVDRVEIIDAYGRVAAWRGQAGAHLMLQDDQHTLKIFLGEPK